MLSKRTLPFFFSLWFASTLVASAQNGPSQPIPQTAPARTRKVVHFSFEGNKLMSPAELSKIAARYEGRELTLDQMKQMAEDVTTAYQLKGYLLSRAIIPQQAFDTDTVRVLIVEGKIGKVKVEGAEHYSPDYIADRFKLASPEGNFRSEDFQRSMILMNELPDLKVKAVLAAGKDVGTTDVTLKVEDSSPIHYGFDYNNYGTAATGVNRVGLDFDAGNLFTQADQVSLRGVVGFPSDHNLFYQVQYQAPVNLDGTTVSASYANGAFSVSQGLGAILDVRGGADIETVGISHPLDRELEFSSNLGLAISHKAIHNNFFGGATPLSRDEYTSSRLTYQADWRQASGRTLVQASWTQGLGGTGSGDPLVSRVGASGGFSKFNFDVVRIQNFQTGLYGVFRASGQVATEPLYIAEQFAVGGPDTVRGYSQAGLLGDNAYVVSAEMRWCPIPKNLDLLQLAAFIDHGGVGLVRPQPGDLPDGKSLTGAGVGVRVGLGEHVSARLDIGFPLAPRNDRVGTSPAVYCGLQTRF